MPCCYCFSTGSRTFFLLLLLVRSMMQRTAKSFTPAPILLPVPKKAPVASASSLLSLNQIPLPTDGNADSNELLKRAAQLRKEIEELESKKASTTADAPNTTTVPSAAVAAAVQYTEVADSVWTISYRFSDQPEPSEDSVNADKPPTERRRFFRGKLVVKFRNDGYTDIVAQEALGAASEQAVIVKAWGWDSEQSSNDNDDGREQEYLLFSIDADLQTLDGGGGEPTTRTQRFYFQARQDKDTRSKIVSLVDGTVTIKQDVVRQSSRWALFSPTGILAQFRYVGDFIAKPCSSTAPNTS